MSCIMKSTLLKPPTMSMPNGCLISSLPPNFTTKSLSNHSSSLSIPFKPIKIHQFSCSFSLPSLCFSFTLFNKHKKSHFPSLIAFVAEDNTAVLEEEEEQTGEFGWENEDSDGAAAEAQVSDWEGDGENEGTVGDAGESAGDEEYSEPSEDAKVFVGNLPFDIDSEKLAHLFEQAGVVEVAEVIYNRETDQSRGFGFVTMSTVEEAEKAVDIFNRYDVNGRLLTVNKAAPKGSRPERQPRVFEPANRIYVGNLPWDVDDARLEQVFSEHGKVLSARVVYDRESARSRGFGFVTMSTDSELNDAIANLDGQSFNGRAIRVNVAEERYKHNK